jgi:hypothetical protein
MFMYFSVVLDDSTDAVQLLIFIRCVNKSSHVQ